MKKLNKFISATLGLAITVSLFSGAVKTNANEITVELDGEKLVFDAKPQLSDGRTLVPMRKIFEEIGALVKWDNETQTVSARKNSKTIELAIGSKDLKISKGDTDDDGNLLYETAELDVPAQLISDRTMVPVRAITEAFGLDVDWDEDALTVRISSKKDDDDSWKENKVKLNLSDLPKNIDGVDVTDNHVSITKGGDYTLSGELNNGSITVSTNDKVKLRLSGVKITSDNNPCIYFEKSDKAYITISDGTENTLTSKECESGVIYSKDNLEIKGNGSLEISSDNGHGIKASDNLTIENGDIVINALNDGIHVNDIFKMTGGNVSISADGDGIDSESIVIISGGILDIKTNGVPIEKNETSESSAPSEKPERDLNSNKDGSDAPPDGFDKMPMHGGMFETSTDVEFEKSTKGIKAEWMMSISGGEINIASSHHSIHCGDEIEINGGIFNLTSEYGKGITAHGNLTISNDETEINIKKSTEGLESKKVLTVNSGLIDIISSDDGINATGGNSGQMPGGGFGGQMPSDGRFDGTNGDFGRHNDNRDKDNAPNPNSENTGKRFDEGERPTPPNMPSGNIPPTDGENADMSQNAPGGINALPSEPPQGEMPKDRNGNNPQEPPQNVGFNNNANMSDCLIINGGNIEITAGDDCIDSNGNLIINGGTIKATRTGGTFTGPFSVLDADGKVEINESATLVAAASGGTEGSLEIPQNNITIYCNETHSADDEIIIKDADGKAITKYIPGGEFSAILITSPKLKTGESYTITIGSESHEVTLTTRDTTVGTKSTTRSPERMSSRK